MHFCPKTSESSPHQMRADFHARFDASGKQYRYFVWNHRRQSAVATHALAGSTGIGPVRHASAAKLFIERHDFKSFAGTRNYEMESTIRHLDALRHQAQRPCLRSSLKATVSSTRCAAESLHAHPGRSGKFALKELKPMLLQGSARRRHDCASTRLVLWKVLWNKPINGRAKPKDP